MYKAAATVCITKASLTINFLPSEPWTLPLTKEAAKNMIGYVLEVKGNFE